MNKQEIRTKMLKRRKILGIITFIILSPLLLPLLLINKLGEISEKIADIIQTPFHKLINKSMTKYKEKLEKENNK
jgi:hypothetical protein